MGSLEEVLVSSRTNSSDWIIGCLMMLLTVSCSIAYYVILSTIYNDKELFRLVSYRFMFFLGIFDVSQCFPHFVTGIFTISQNVFNPIFAKAMGVLATPGYVTFTLLTIFLSINRFIQLSSPSFENFFFGGNRWMIWIGISGVFWFLFALALASPWATIRYNPEWYSWSYDGSLQYSSYVQTVEMIIEVGGIFISAFFYALIIFRLIKTKKKFMTSKNHNAEIKVLIQATVITVYCTILNVLWHNYTRFLPSNLFSYTLLNLMWICNSSVHPIMYFIVNKALRHRIASKTLTNVFSGNMHHDVHTDHTIAGHMRD